MSGNDAPDGFSKDRKCTALSASALEKLS